MSYFHFLRLTKTTKKVQHFKTFYVLHASSSYVSVGQQHNIVANILRAPTCSFDSLYWIYKNLWYCHWLWLSTCSDFLPAPTAATTLTLLAYCYFPLTLRIFAEIALKIWMFRCCGRLCVLQDMTFIAHKQSIKMTLLSLLQRWL